MEIFPWVMYLMTSSIFSRSFFYSNVGCPGLILFFFSCFPFLYPIIFSQNVLNFAFEFFLLIFHVCHHNFNFQELLFASMLLLYSSLLYKVSSLFSGYKHELFCCCCYFFLFSLHYCYYFLCLFWFPSFILEIILKCLLNLIITITFKVET